jgi:AraC family transcriptional regulator
MQHVRELIMARYAEPVQLSTIAAALGFSLCHFSRLFHSSMGLPFRDFILQVRLSAAMRLMTGTDRPLRDIALAAGFGDQVNFSRLFVRSIGITPLKWRQMVHACYASTRRAKQ